MITKIYLVILLFITLISCQSETLQLGDIVFDGSENNSQDGFYKGYVSFDAPDSYPEFSWDNIQVCLHMSKQSDDFTSQELEFIAQCPLVHIEKTQAIGQYLYVDVGAKRAAEAIKEINPKCKVLIYMSSCTDYGDRYSSGTILTDDKRPDWALKYAEGYDHGNDAEYGDYVMTGTRRRYDPTTEEMQDWWVDTTNGFMESETLDGMYVDMMLIYSSHESTNLVVWGEDNYWGIRNGAMNMFAKSYASANLSNDFIISNYLIGRTTAMPDYGVSYYDVTHGAMIEQFAREDMYSKEQMEIEIELIRGAASQGKAVVAKAWPRYHTGNTDEYSHLSDDELEAIAREDIIFPLACFLVAAGQHCYFCYSWGWDYDQGSLIDYDEYKKPLGKPLGDAVKNGYKYTRSFEYASVWLDLENKLAEINWKE